MEKKPGYPVYMALASLALAVLSFIILPDTVIIQFSAGAAVNTTAPKLVAIMIPFALGAGGALLAILIGDEHKTNSKKFILISAIGIAVFVIMIVVNLIMQ